MFSSKPVALALCVAVAGCAHSGQNTEAQVVAKSESQAAVTHWWWPFGAKKEEAKDVKKTVAMPDPKITQAWLDEYEPRLREALKGSKFELERRENLLVVTAPVDSAFNPDRPSMLMPSTLGPFSRVAKLVEGDNQVAVLILGHADSTGNELRNRELSLERARSVTAIFRLSGLKNNRLMVRGFGSDLPRAANDSLQGRALNRRVEILLTPQATMSALLAKYSQPAKAQPVTEALVQNEPKPSAAVKAKSLPAKSKPAVAAKAKVAPVKVAKAKPAVQKSVKGKEVVVVEPAKKP
ncbi:OmpA family protein [Pseudomonas sp. 2FG]|uniref:OmpA family protein n=1 Tax=Pseudomonas sp. 2FG TaxID=2502191 RepID=UPI0010F83AFE|nr:OmpA family protein [Pseudomonas sp. 2FG]